MSSELELDLVELPAAYRRWQESELGRITDRIEEELILDLIGPPSGKRLLDVGCGDGVFSVRLAQGGAGLMGIDDESRMLVTARRHANEASIQADFIEGDAQALPFEDGAFDIVAAVTVLCFVSDPDRAFRKIARVLRPGGQLVIGGLCRCSSWAAKRRMAGWLGPRTWSAVRFRAASDLEKLAVAAGLEVETVRSAVNYPPGNFCARWLSSFDDGFSRLMNLGAAFIVLVASKPMQTHGEQ